MLVICQVFFECLFVRPFVPSVCQVMVSAQYLRGARQGGEIFWPVGQKFWARGEMKTYIRHWRQYRLFRKFHKQAEGSRRHSTSSRRQSLQNGQNTNNLAQELLVLLSELLTPPSRSWRVHSASLASWFRLQLKLPPSLVLRKPS